MKIAIQPITEPLDLGEYHEQYRETIVHVWVNPPAEFLAKHDQLLLDYQIRLVEHGIAQVDRRSQGQLPGWLKKLVRPAPERPAAADLRAAADELNRWINEEWHPALLDWFAELFSQGPERVSRDDLLAIHRGDSTMLEWIKSSAMRMIQEYIDGKKKGLLRPSTT